MCHIIVSYIKLHQQANIINKLVISCSTNKHLCPVHSNICSIIITLKTKGLRNNTKEYQSETRTNETH